MNLSLYLLTVLVMKLRAMSSSLALRDSAGGRP